MFTTTNEAIESYKFGKNWNIRYGIMFLLKENMCHAMSIMMLGGDKFKFAQICLILVANLGDDLLSNSLPGPNFISK